MSMTLGSWMKQVYTLVPLTQCRSLLLVLKSSFQSMFQTVYHKVMLAKYCRLIWSFFFFIQLYTLLVIHYLVHLQALSKAIKKQVVLSLYVISYYQAMLFFLLLTLNAMSRLLQYKMSSSIHLQSIKPYYYLCCFYSIHKTKLYFYQCGLLLYKSIQIVYHLYKFKTNLITYINTNKQ